MDYAQTNRGESFFLEGLNVEKVFAFIERTDYFFLYNIRKCMERSSLEDGVYLNELAEYMNISMPELSKAVKNLEEKGYVVWKTDEKKEHTFVTLTNKAIELVSGQKRRMMECYEKIITNIRAEDMETTLLTLGRIRELIAEEK